MERPRLRIAEVAGTVLLLGVIGLRIFSYPYFADNSRDIDADDGYPYYARHLDETGMLIPEFRRLPGYPWFLVASAHLTGFYYSKAGYYVQGFLSYALILALWIPIRRTFGPVVTILLLGMLAAPNLWIRLSVLTYPDFLSSVLWGAFALTVLRWTGVTGWPGHLRWGCAALLLVALMILLKPGVSILVGILAVSVVAAHVLTTRRWTDSGPLAVKMAGLVAGAVALQGVIVAICGPGSVTFYRAAMHARVATYLPPAGDSEAERIVERAKMEISAREGQRMEDENFTNTIAVVQPAVEAVWLDRLLARPLTYFGVMLDEVRRKHYFIAASYAPFMADTLATRARIPPNDGSPASRIYRRFGTYLPGVGEGVASTSAALAEAIFRLGLFWGSLIGGLRVLARRWPLAIVTGILSMGAYTAALAFGIFIDGRYLLPFAPLIYLAQAAGFAALLSDLNAKS